MGRPPLPIIHHALGLIDSIDGFQLCIILMKLQSSRKKYAIDIPQIPECPGAALFGAVGAAVGE